MHLSLNRPAAMFRLGGAIASLALPVSSAVAQARSDSTAVAIAVERYHKALSIGDSAAALTLLSPTAVIAESGSIESFREYRSHHLPADIAFARAVKATRSRLQVTVRGVVAWTTATTAARGTYGGKPIDSAGAELMVLTRSEGGWIISAIHWSSRSPSSK